MQIRINVEKASEMAFFVSEAFISAIPGIIAQIVLIPILVIFFEKYTEK